MVTEALKRRLAELESTRGTAEDPPFILIQVADASRDGDAHLDDEARVANVAAVTLNTHVVTRDAGETVDDLCARAAKLHDGPEAVPVMLAVPLSQMPAAGSMQ
jgi:hypothetical protein